MAPPHHYRITVDALDPSAGEEGLQSLSFFASMHCDIFAAVGALRERLQCTACAATKLAVGLGLLSEVLHQQHLLLTPPLEPMREFIATVIPAAQESDSASQHAGSLANERKTGQLRSGSLKNWLNMP